MLKSYLTLKMTFWPMITSNHKNNIRNVFSEEKTQEKLVYALMYSRAKCLLKLNFLFILIWNIVVMRKKRDCIFF